MADARPEVDVAYGSASTNSSHSSSSSSGCSAKEPRSPYCPSGHGLLLRRPSWWVLSWVVILVLACTLAALWGCGLFSRQETLKYAAMLLVVIFTTVGLSGREAPRPRVRALMAAVMLAVTVVVMLLPWLLHGPGAWGVCDSHYYGDSDAGTWYTRPGFVDVCFAALITPVAMACVAAWYPPSHYARGAVLCVIMIWFMKLGWICIGFLDWCGSPLSGANRKLLRQSLFGLSIGLVIVSLLMANLLIVLRVEALEETMGKRRSGPMRSVVALYCLSLLVNDFTSGNPKRQWFDVHDYIPIPGLTKGHTTVFDLAFPLFPLAISLLIARVFALPLSVLREEARRVRGAPQVQARWAARTLRGEMAGALCMTTLLVMKFAYQPFSWGLGEGGRLGGNLLTLISSLSDVANLVGTAVMCGLLWQQRPPAPPSRPPGAARGAAPGAGHGDAWQRQVERLAGRGFALGALLDFHESLLEGKAMPGFSPRRSTTNDVVRRAVIPLSRGATGGSALAAVWNGGEPVLPQRMVTHHWDNVFLHLAASVVADGLGRDTYDEVAERLADMRGVQGVRAELLKRGSLTRTYWVCAFSINQHAGICGSFGPRPPDGSAELREWAAKTRDSVSGVELPVCDCCEPKHFNSSPVECEMNKFDDMMAYLFRTVPDFCQVVAVDTSFALFTRAWCVAELVEADAAGMPQGVKVHSQANLDSFYDELSNLDVRACRASRAEDRDFILGKVGDTNAFNARLQWLVFGAEGLFRSWVDSTDRAAVLGRLTRRALAARGKAGTL